LAAATEANDAEDNNKKKKKNRHTTEELRELAKSVRSGTFHYDGRPKKSLNWASYNEAQVNEMADTLNLIKRFVDRASARIPERPRSRGRPPSFPARDVAKALLLQTYFGVSDRVAAGLVRLFKEKLGIANEFSYKTIERGYDPSPVSEILREVFRLTNEHGNSKETTFSVDGTGEPTSSKVNYESVRSEQRSRETHNDDEDDDQKSADDGDDDVTTAAASSSLFAWSSRHEFQLTVSSVGVHTKMYAGFRTTGDRSIGELSFLPSVVAQTRINCPRMETILGDSLYANRPACAVVAGYDATPYFLPKSNSIFLSLGVPSWNNMTHAFIADPQRWLMEYHMRSMSETSNSMDKTEFPEKIRRKIPQRKDAVSSLRIYVHNIRRYAYMRYLQPELLKPLRN
jgi:transposase